MRSIQQFSRNYRFGRNMAVLTGSLLAVVAALGITPMAQAQINFPDGACPSDVADRNLSCVSNDVSVASVDFDVSTLPTSCVAGSTVNLDIKLGFVINANSERYDIGTWIAREPGDIKLTSANGGPTSCNLLTLTQDRDSEAPPLDSGIPDKLPIVQVVDDLDTDACFDVRSATKDYYFASDFPDEGGIDVTCLPDANGNLTFQTMVSWDTGRVQANCDGGPDDYANILSNSKCSADSPITLPIPVLSRLIIEKQTTPDGLSDQFDFSGTITDDQGQPQPIALFQLTDDGEKELSGALDATYKITETIQDGFEIGSIACTNQTTGAPANFTSNTLTGEVSVVMSGSQFDVRCVYTNNQLPGQLTVVKTANGDNDTFSFAYGVEGQQPTAFSLTTVNNTASNIIQITSADLGQTFSVAEGLTNTQITNGWSIESAECVYDDAPDTPIGSVGPTSPDLISVSGFTIDAGEEVTCTFVNNAPAQVTVTKVALGGTDGDSFQFVSDLPFSNNTNPSGTFDLTLAGGGDNTGPITVPVPDSTTGRSVSILENIQAATGYTLADITCSGADETVNNNVVTFNAQPGDIVNCTFTNAADGSLTIVKDTEGAPDATFTFSTNIAGGTTAFDIQTANNTGSQFFNTTGLTGTAAITFTETAKTGWDLTGLLCVEDGPQDSGWDIGTRTVLVNIDPGETVVCTFTNTQRGQIVIEKETNPIGTEVFGFTSTSVPSTGIPASFDVTAGTPVTFDNGGLGLLPGRYTVTENDPTPGFDLTALNCVDEVVPGPTDSTGDFLSRVATINLDPGETVTCTFTNTQRANLVIRKAVTVDGPLVSTFDFTSSTLTPNAFSLGPVTAAVPVETSYLNLTPGVYDVAEDQLAALADGWALVGASCADGSSVDLINLDPGEDLTCTFINAPLGSATIIKETVGGDGIDDIFDYIGTAPFEGLVLDVPIGGTASADFTNQLDPLNNPYSITENTPLPAGWSLTGLGCTEVGGTDVTGTPSNTPSTTDLDTLTATINADYNELVTCTFTNTADGTITIRKQTAPADVDLPFVFTGTAPELTGSIRDFDIATEELLLAAQPAVYSTTETVPPGWQITDIICTGGFINSTVTFTGANTGATDAFEAGDDTVNVTLAAGENVDCTFENTQESSITIVKSVVGAGGPFNFASTSLGAFTLTPADNGADQTVFSGLLPNMYMVNETPVPTGYQLTDITCTGGSDVTIGSTGVTINLAPGEDVVCGFENTQLGSITIGKQTLPSGSPVSFTFNGDVSGSLLDGQTATLNVLPGTYTSTETVPAGWDLVELTCDDGNSTGDTGTATATFNVEPGEDVICSFVNVQRSTVNIVKVVVNDNGGNATVGDFGITSNVGTLTFDGGVVVGDTATYTASVTGIIPAAQYSVSEVPFTGYQAGTWACVNGAGTSVLVNDGAAIGTEFTVPPGDTVTCTITNDDEAARLALTKVVTNDNGGTAVNTEWTLSAAGPTPISGAGGVAATPVNAGVYTLSESAGPAGYSAGAWQCNGGSLNGDVLTLGSGESAACTITNDDEAARLALTKVVTNDNGGTAVNTEWTLSAAGPTPISGAGGVVATPVNAGVYTLSESAGPAGYSAGAWQCTGGSLNGDVLTLGSGESAACTITNDDEAARLALTKVVTNDNGGTAVNTEWTLSAAGPTPISGAGGVVATPVNAGVYTLSESAGPAGYSAGAWQCTGGSLNGDVLTLGSGESAACTITNDDEAARLALTKVVTNDNGGTAVNTEWTLSAAGPTPISGAGGVAATSVDAGIYTLSESTGPDGYTAGAWSCTGGTLNGDSLTLGSGETASCSITNDDVAPGLTLVKTLTLDNGGTAVVTDWTLSAAGSVDTISGVSGSASVTGAPVTADTYVLSEANGPTGYTAGDWLCQGATSQNGSSVVIGAGQSVVCTINNDDEPGRLDLTKIVVNDNGGTAVETEWTLSAAGPTPLSGAGGVAATSVDAGDYTLSESTGPDGYTASAWSCTGGTLNGDVLTLGNGETASCSITNDDVAPGLTLVKTLTLDNGGTAVVTDWTLSAAGSVDTISGVSGSAPVTGAPVTADTYVLSEANGPTGYTAGDWVCQGATSQNGNSVVIGAGESVVCTINNDDEPATLTLVKTVTNDDQGEAEATEWTLSATGSSSSITGLTGTPAVTAVDVFAGTYTLAEAGGPLGYTASAWDCGQANVAGDQLTLENGEDVVCTINNDDDPAILNLAKTVNGPATLEGDGTYTVVYTIVATNSGGPGKYNLEDTFSPGDGITLNTADAVYVPGTEDDQSGTLGAYPTFVTDEGLAPGLNESWTVTASFTVDPALLDPATSSCDPASPVVNTGFYNYVEGSVTDVDLTDNAACTGLDDPGINLAKTVASGPTLEADGTYTVVYTITATNTGGIGVYDLVDTFSPGTGITLNTADAVYLAGSEDSQTGTTAAYPNFVADEGLGEGMDESWTVTANFTVDPATLDPATSSCDPAAPAINTGFYNYVEGSATDSDLTDNETCTGLDSPGINLAKTVNGAATMEIDGTYTVVYTITATNTGGVGVYDLVDTFSPGAGITLNTADAVYMAGSEDSQTGTTAAYPNFVTDEGLGEGMNESWTVTANFAVDPALADPVSSQCDPSAPAINTGFYNAVEGSATDTDLTDNETCTSLPFALLTVVKQVNGGPALPADFVLTLTGVDGTHDSGVDYVSGDQPAVLVGIAYTLSEMADQVPDYTDAGVSCVDDNGNTPVPHPVTLSDGQSVTCTQTNTFDALPPIEIMPVPVNDKLALLLLTLMMLVAGWYFRPVTMRKF